MRGSYFFALFASPGSQKWSQIGPRVPKRPLKGHPGTPQIRKKTALGPQEVARGVLGGPGGTPREAKSPKILKNGPPTHQNLLQKFRGGDALTDTAKKETAIFWTTYINRDRDTPTAKSNYGSECTHMHLSAHTGILHACRLEPNPHTVNEPRLRDTNRRAHISMSWHLTPCLAGFVWIYLGSVCVPPPPSPTQLPARITNKLLQLSGKGSKGDKG